MFRGKKKNNLGTFKSESVRQNLTLHFKDCGFGKFCSDRRRTWDDLEHRKQPWPSLDELCDGQRWEAGLEVLSSAEWPSIECLPPLLSSLALLPVLCRLNVVSR